MSVFRSRTDATSAMGALVTDEPSAEQPSRQETPGAGQAPSAPVGFRVVGRSGPGVRWSEVIRARRGLAPPMVVDGRARDTIAPGALAWDAGEYDIIEPIAEPPAPDVDTEELLHDAARLVRRLRRLHPDDEVAAMESTPPPAAGTLSVNATGTCVHCGERGYIGIDHWERCEKHPARAHIAALEARLAQAERERDEDVDECMKHVEESMRIKKELGRQVEKMAAHVATMRVERDEATAKERARCLAWWDVCNVSRDMCWTDLEYGIREGKPAPGTDEPPKCDPDPPGKVVRVCAHGINVYATCRKCIDEGLVASPREVAPDRRWECRCRR
jgi:hypothetical protein